MSEEKSSTQQKDSPRSIRITDDTFDRFKKLYHGVEGVNQEAALKELLDLRERISLEGDQEFGSQIKQVNDLTSRIGEIFISVINHSNTKSELQVAAFEKLKNSTSDEINRLNEELKKNKEQLEQVKKESLEHWRTKHELQRRETDYEERINELKNVIQEKNDKFASLEQRIERANQDILTIDELKKTVLHLQGEKESLAKQFKEELKNKDFELERALFNKEKELHATYNKELHEQIEKTESYREQLEQKREELLSLRNKVMELETNNNVLQNENSKLKQTKEYPAENDK